MARQTLPKIINQAIGLGVYLDEKDANTFAELMVKISKKALNAKIVKDAKVEPTTAVEVKPKDK